MPEAKKNAGPIGRGPRSSRGLANALSRAIEPSACNCERQASAAIASIQALPHVLAGLEKGNRLFVHRNMRSGARIAANPCVPVFHREGAEPTQFDPVAARQGAGDFIENCIDDFFYIAEVEMRITVGNPLYKLGFDHRPQPNFSLSKTNRGAPSLSCRRQLA